MDLAKTYSEIIDDPGMGRMELFALPTDEQVLFTLLKDLFSNHWDKLVFGSLVQGAVFEIRAPNAPQKVSIFDGYLTVDFGAWHFHVCIGQHKGTPCFPVALELAHHRRTARAELVRLLNSDGTPRSWMLRLANGKDEQQMTVFLPNPFLDGEKIVKTPDWSRLSLWDELRARYLGLPPDPLDRAGEKFRCGGH